MNVFTKINSLAKSKGISISELCRMAGVKRMSFEQWKKKTPKTLEIYFKLMDALGEMESEFKPGGERWS